MNAQSAARVIGPTDGEAVLLASIGVRFLIAGDDVGERFALVEHPMPPRALAAPLHRHNREDEYSFVLEGKVGALLGDDLVLGGHGDLIFKPRGQWHTFWNAGDEPARILELISPAGFERYFREMSELPSTAQPADRAAIAVRYELDVESESIARLTQEHGLRFGRAPA